MVIKSLVKSPKNYYFSLYPGIPATSTTSLANVIRSSIRVLHRIQLYDYESVNYHLVNSKCLNIYQRSTFSYLKPIFKILMNRFPNYLNDLLHFRVYKIDLRNPSTRLLIKSKYKLLRYGKLSFSLSTANIWNALPVTIRTNLNYSSYIISNVLLLIRKN